MAAKSNATKLSYAVEASLETLPVTADWYEVGWTSIDTIGTTIGKTEIRPVNQNAMDEKSIVTDLDSALSYSNDLTISAFRNHAQGFFRSDFQDQTTFSPTDVTSTGYTVTADGDLDDDILIYARGFSNAANNGFKITAGTSTETEVKTTGLVEETSPPTGARIDVVGIQGATGDIELDSDGNLTSTTLDFTGLGITVGQSIYVGGATAATKFATAGYTGLVRVRVIEENKLTIDKRPWTVAAADNGSGKTIQLFIGNFIRNVARDHTDYNAESYTFEAEYSGLEAGNTTVYKYPQGARANEMTLNFPLTDKATTSFGFITTDTPNPTSSKASGNRYYRYYNNGFGTSSDCTQLRIKDSSLVDYTTTFKDLTLTINNSISAEKVLCALGAADMNDSNFRVSGSAQVLMTDEDMISAVRNNETLSLDYAVNNDDGALHFDIPSLTFATASDTLPEDASVIINFDIMAHRDTFFNFVMSCTHFNFLPI